jgi:hypothetical protein
MADPERATIPVDLTEHARELERRDREAPSGVLPVVAPTGVPWVVVSFDELKALPLDPQAAFVLSLIDGRFTVETIVDMCGLGVNGALRVFGKLLDLGVIEIRGERRAADLWGDADVDP